MLLATLLGGRGRRVPIFPLNTVLYPGMRLPLRVFEVRYMDMAKESLKAGKPFGVCLIREGAEVGAPAVPEPVGCLARILEADMDEPGILRITAEGLERFRIADLEVTPANLVVAKLDDFPDEVGGDAPGLAECAGFLAKAIAGIGPGRFSEPFRYDDASWVGFRLAEILPLRNDVKQKLLELSDATMRLAVLHKFLQQQRLL